MPNQPGLHGADNIDCTDLDGKPCALCEQYTNFETDILAAKALIREGEKRLAEVEERRRLFRANVNAKNDRLAGRLPAELVSAIFTETLTRQLMPGLEDHIIDSPLFLGAVCQAWRRIAWSTPALWNWIHIFLRRPENKHLEETVKEWLGRSGTLPLTIQITCGNGVVDAVDPDFFLPGTGIFGNFVADINACSIRWNNISFTVPGPTVDFLSGSDNGTPILQLLRINTTDGLYHRFRLERPAHPRSLAFGRLPAWENMNILWDNLVKIHLERFTAGVCVRALQEMPRLTDCVLMCDGDENRDLGDAPAGRFIHPTIQKFVYITGMTGHLARSLFDHFVFPGLTDLRIVCNADYLDIDQVLNHIVTGHDMGSLSLWNQSIKPFIIHSAPELLSLTLRLPFTLESLSEVLNNQEHLTTLVLKDPTPQGIFDVHSFLLNLADTPSNSTDQDHALTLVTPFLPSLKSLSISGRIVDTLEKSAFEAMLDACEPPSSFRTPSIGRRPLTEMIVTPREIFRIQRSDMNLRRASALIDAGIILQVIDPHTRKDVLELGRI